jgi:hypothetical protein
MLWLLAQGLPDPSPVIQRATGVSWEAGMLAIIIFVFMVGIMYMIKKSNDNMSEERKAAQAREAEYRLQLKALEEKVHAIQLDSSGKLITITEKVVTALLESKEAQLSSKQAIEDMSVAITEMKADLRRLCGALELCPCLVLRHGYKIIDPTGKVVEPNEVPITTLQSSKV